MEVTPAREDIAQLVAQIIARYALQWAIFILLSLPKLWTPVALFGGSGAIWPGFMPTLKCLCSN